MVKSKSEGLIKEAELQAENIKKEKMLQAKENFLRLKEEHEVAIKDRERKLQSNEDRARAKEKNIDQKLKLFENKQCPTCQSDLGGEFHKNLKKELEIEADDEYFIDILFDYCFNEGEYVRKLLREYL